MVISKMAFQNILIPHHPSAFKLVSSPIFLISLSNSIIHLVDQANLRGLLDAPYFHHYQLPDGSRISLSFSIPSATILVLTNITSNLH